MSRFRLSRCRGTPGEGSGVVARLTGDGTRSASPSIVRCTRSRCDPLDGKALALRVRLLGFLTATQLAENSLSGVSRFANAHQSSARCSCACRKLGNRTRMGFAEKLCPLFVRARSLLFCIRSSRSEEASGTRLAYAARLSTRCVAVGRCIAEVSRKVPARGHALGASH